MRGLHAHPLIWKGYHDKCWTLVCAGDLRLCRGCRGGAQFLLDCRRHASRWGNAQSSRLVGCLGCCCGRVGGRLFLTGWGGFSQVLGSMVRHALAKRRNDILGRLAFLPLAIVALVAWLGGSAFLTGGHWVPTPWDITGDWVAPSEWPSLGSRWFLGL